MAKIEDVEIENSDIDDIDVSCVSRNAIIATLPIIGVEGHYWFYDVVTSTIKSWGLSGEAYDRIMYMLDQFVILNQELISDIESPLITITYDTVFGDIELRIFTNNSIIPLIIYGIRTQKIKITDTRPDEDGGLPILLEQVHTYKVGELLSYMTSEREAILGDFEKMVADGQKITTMTKQEIKKTIFEKLQDELGRDVKIELSPKGHLGAVYITLNDKTSEFKAGDSMTNLLITIIRRTRNFEIYMPADDLYLDMFGHDDYYLTEEQRADEKIAHRRHVNMRKLDDTIRNINLKIRRETGTNRNLIIKNRDKYRLNPELQRLKKTRKTKK